MMKKQRVCVGTGKNNHPMLEMTQGWSYCVVSDGGGVIIGQVNSVFVLFPISIVLFDPKHTSRQQDDQGCSSPVKVRTSA